MNSQNVKAKSVRGILISPPVKVSAPLKKGPTRRLDSTLLYGSVAFIPAPGDPRRSHPDGSTAATGVRLAPGKGRREGGREEDRTASLVSVRRRINGRGRTVAKDRVACDVCFQHAPFDTLVTHRAHTFRLQTWLQGGIMTKLLIEMNGNASCPPPRQKKKKRSVF